ncbi:hypothetical protein LIER_29309 [Lithospermum erythrorhizon]|uniref:Reverse transcriptase n=1 Tax=Lithospermum erythrorhizon TaxID=34254 RepID=A0AAV3RLS3_LITER
MQDSTPVEWVAKEAFQTKEVMDNASEGEVEIHLEMARVSYYDDLANEHGLWLKLDLLEEKRDAAIGKMSRDISKVASHYNKRVHGSKFLVGDLVLRARQAFAYGKLGKLESPWEGPYLVRRIPQEDAPANIPELVNLRFGGTMLEVGNSHPPEIAEIIQEMIETIISRVMMQLQEQLPQLRGENLVEVSSIREAREETYAYTYLVQKGNKLMARQQSRHDATARDAMAPTPPPDAIEALLRQVDALSTRVAGQARHETNIELATLAPFSPGIHSAVMPVGFKLLTFTKFTGKTDPEEHITEFQSQMSFH